MIYILIGFTGLVSSYLVNRFLPETLRRVFGFVLMILSATALFTLYPEKIEYQLEIIIACFVFGLIISARTKRKP